jgi:hypothetical protein
MLYPWHERCFGYPYYPKQRERPSLPVAKVAAARVKVAHWAADITTVAPPHGTCSGDAARVLATALHKKVQGWAKEIRSLALCKRRLPQKLLES